MKSAPLWGKTKKKKKCKHINPHVSVYSGLLTNLCFFFKKDTWHQLNHKPKVATLQYFCIPFNALTLNNPTTQVALCTSFSDTQNHSSHSSRPNKTRRMPSKPSWLLIIKNILAITLKMINKPVRTTGTNGIPLCPVCSLFITHGLCC